MQIGANKQAKLPGQRPGIGQTLPPRRLSAVEPSRHVHANWLTDLVQTGTPFTEGNLQKLGQRRMSQTIRRPDVDHQFVKRSMSKVTLSSDGGQVVINGDVACAVNSLAAALP